MALLAADTGNAMRGLTARLLWEACQHLSVPRTYSALLVDFVNADQSTNTPSNCAGLVITVSPEMILEVLSYPSNDASILLRVVLSASKDSPLQLSASQVEFLPELIAIIARHLLQSSDNRQVADPDGVDITAVTNALTIRRIDEIEQAAKERFNRSPFALTASDRFALSELKALLSGTRAKTAALVTAPIPVAAPETLSNNSMPAGKKTDMPTFADTPSSDARGLFDPPPPVGSADLRELRKHVVNLHMGKFSQDGSFNSTKETVATIFDVHLKQWIKDNEGQPVRLLLYAHGGLTSEEWGLYTASFQRKWWLEHGVYPIFFVWETGLMESLLPAFTSRQLPIESSRGTASAIAQEFADKGVEILARTLAAPRVWGGMKQSAQLTFEPSGDGRVVLQHIKDLAKELKESKISLEIHGVGHSAGSIFLSYAMQAAAAMQLPRCDSLHFMAPAITCELFKSILQPLVGTGAKSTIDSLSIFTLTEELERADSVGPSNSFNVYHKSLLYLIYNALEPVRQTPILGLEECLLSYSGLAKFFGLASNTNRTLASVVFSPTDSSAVKNSRSLSQAHGDFDNDPETMESVLRRICKKRNNENVTSFPKDDKLRAVTRTLFRGESSSPVGFTPAPFVPSGIAPERTGQYRQLALCIGIDEYPGANRLSGCVYDCNAWSKWLQGRGFQVQQLINGEATLSSISGAIKKLFETSQPGDVIAIQYAGHGTSVEDLNGDEANGDTPGRDEALVPIDYQGGNLLLDDDIGELCRQIKPGVSVTFFMDCCNSGTNTRMFMSRRKALADNQKARFMRLEADVVAAFKNNRQSGQRAMRAFSSPYKGTREILFAACRSGESALETSGQGDFTRHAMAVLAQNGNLTTQKFLEAVLERFGAAPKQTPGLWCDDSLRQSLLLGQVNAT